MKHRLTDAIDYVILKAADGDMDPGSVEWFALLGYFKLDPYNRADDETLADWIQASAERHVERYFITETA